MLLNAFGMVVVSGPLGLAGLLVWQSCFRLIFPASPCVSFLDSDGRIFSMLIEVGSSRVNVLNIYAPNTISDRKVFFESLHGYFISQGELITAGDFNCVDSTSDRLHSNDVHSSDKLSLSSLKSNFLLTDVWRKRNPRAISFTWSNSNITQASRIDRFFISKPLLAKVSSCNILPCVFSDHDFIDLYLDLDGFSTCRSCVWKFNTSLLADPEFVQMMTCVIEKHKLAIDQFDSLGDWWDNLKSVIRDKCVNFSVQKRRRINLRRNLLTRQLVRAKGALHSGDSRAAVTIKNLETDLASLISKEAEGAKVRSRAEWIKKGEKPTRYFFRLEQKRADKNSFTSLVDGNGVESSTQNELEAILVQFYSSLFCKDTLNMQIQTDLINDLDLSLDELECQRCEGAFSKEELLSALQGLPTGKALDQMGCLPNSILRFGLLLVICLFQFLTSASVLVSLLIASARLSCVWFMRRMQPIWLRIGVQFPS